MGGTPSIKRYLQFATAPFLPKNALITAVRTHQRLCDSCLPIFELIVKNAEYSFESANRFLAAEWRYLVMLNWAVDPDVLEPHVPPGTTLDAFEGKTYVSAVGFLFLNTRLLGMPIPFHRNFEEVNLRFYVRRETAGEVRRGVTFIKELVPKWAIATVARWSYNEPYDAVPMRHEISGFDSLAPSAQYEWKRNGRWNRLKATAGGESAPLVEGSVEEFIAEHYYGYGTLRNGFGNEYKVDHPPWNVWRADTTEFDCDIAGNYGEKFVQPLSNEPASAFIADGSKIAVYRPNRLKERRQFSA